MLYNQKQPSKRFRDFLLQKAKIHNIIEMSSVRKLVFENADASAVIISFNYSDGNNLDNVINYTLEDWPKAIRNNLNFPEELQPRCEWSICQRIELCKQIEIPINKIIEQLRGTEDKLSEFCEKNNLKKGLNIVIHGEAMNLPELVLPSTEVSYFGKLGVETAFDIYT